MISTNSYKYLKTSTSKKFVDNNNSSPKQEQPQQQVIPDELWLPILQFCDKQTFANVSQVNKQINDISDSAEMCQYFLTKVYDQEGIEKYKKRFPFGHCDTVKQKFETKELGKDPKLKNLFAGVKILTEAKNAEDLNLNHVNEVSQTKIKDPSYTKNYYKTVLVEMTLKTAIATLFKNEDFGVMIPDYLSVLDHYCQKNVELQILLNTFKKAIASAPERSKLSGAGRQLFDDLTNEINLLEEENRERNYYKDEHSFEECFSALQGIHRKCDFVRNANFLHDLLLGLFPVASAFHKKLGNENSEKELKGLLQKLKKDIKANINDSRCSCCNEPAIWAKKLNASLHKNVNAKNCLSKEIMLPTAFQMYHQYTEKINKFIDSNIRHMYKLKLHSEIIELLGDQEKFIEILDQQADSMERAAPLWERVGSTFGMEQMINFALDHEMITSAMNDEVFHFIPGFMPGAMPISFQVVGA